MEGQKIAEFAHDLQSGLSRHTVPQFDRLPFVGMASIVAMHIRGLGEIEYGVLRQVADYFFDIPSLALPEVVRILAEIEYVQLISTGPTTYKSVIPQVPHFSSVHEGLGQYVHTLQLTEHELLSVRILSELTSKAEKRASLFARLGPEKLAFDACETIVTTSGLVIPKRARGHDIWVSPAYFADNLDAVADMAATGDSPRIARLLQLLKLAQGWPLSLIESKQEIAGHKIDAHELAILKALVGDGVLKPPSIERPSAAAEHFVFTPRPGNVRLDASKREIYERAMALVAAVRKGQLLPEAIRIKWPVAILKKLRDNKKIGANSDARVQYGNLVALRIGRLVKLAPKSDRHEFHLIENEENLEAVNEAIALLQTGESATTGVNAQAQLALAQEERYIQSLVAAAKLKQREKVPLGPEAQREIEQLILNL